MTDTERRAVRKAYGALDRADRELRVLRDKDFDTVPLPLQDLYKQAETVLQSVRGVYRQLATGRASE